MRKQFLEESAQIQPRPRSVAEAIIKVIRKIKKDKGED